MSRAENRIRSALLTGITGQDGYERPHDVAHVLGNPDKARRELGWQPRRSFSDLVTDMVNADLELL
jgi:GDP-D-mannose dehydratase